MKEAKGYNQVKGIDYEETFAPTANIISIRALMQLAVNHDLVVHQMDVKTAYLHAPIDQEIYIVSRNCRKSNLHYDMYKARSELDRK